MDCTALIHTQSKKIFCSKSITYNAVNLTTECAAWPIQSCHTKNFSSVLHVISRTLPSFIPSSTHQAPWISVPRHQWKYNKILNTVQMTWYSCQSSFFSNAHHHRTLKLTTTLHDEAIREMMITGWRNRWTEPIWSFSHTENKEKITFHFWR